MCLPVILGVRQTLCRKAALRECSRTYVWPRSLENHGFCTARSPWGLKFCIRNRPPRRCLRGWSLDHALSGKIIKSPSVCLSFQQHFETGAHLQPFQDRGPQTHQQRGQQAVGQAVLSAPGRSGRAGVAAEASTRTMVWGGQNPSWLGNLIRVCLKI